MRIPKRSDSVTKSIAINKKDPNGSDLFRQMVEIGSRLTASAHGKHAFLSSFICASVQPDTDDVRSGLHSPYLRHENNKKTSRA